MSALGRALRPDVRCVNCGLTELQAYGTGGVPPRHPFGLWVPPLGECSNRGAGPRPVARGHVFEHAGPTVGELQATWERENPGPALASQDLDIPCADCGEPVARGQFFTYVLNVAGTVRHSEHPPATGDPDAAAARLVAFVAAAQDQEAVEAQPTEDLLALLDAGLDDEETEAVSDEIIAREDPARPPERVRLRPRPPGRYYRCRECPEAPRLPEVEARAGGEVQFARRVCRLCSKNMELVEPRVAGGPAPALA